MTKERRQGHNIGSHREKMALRRKLQAERPVGFIRIYTKKELENYKKEAQDRAG